MESEHKKLLSYTITVSANRLDEDGIPVFSYGKLLHVMQNICSNYTGSFSISHVTEHVFCDGKFSEEDRSVITLEGTPEEDVNAIAEDLCTFLQIDKVRIRKFEGEYYSVTGGIDM